MDFICFAQESLNVISQSQSTSTRILVQGAGMEGFYFQTATAWSQFQH